MGFSESSTFAKVAFVLSIVGAIVLVIGFATTSWLTVETRFVSTSIGLFSFCSTSGGRTACSSSNSLLQDSLSWYEATRAFEIIAFLVAIALVVVLIVWIFVKSDMKILHTVSLILAFVAAVCVFIGVITFGVESVDVFSAYKLGWSFGLTIVSGIIFVITGILLVLDKVIARTS